MKYTFSNIRPVDILVEYRRSRSRVFASKYNIVFNEDGSIYDPDLKKQFGCMYNWARALCNQKVKII